MNRIHHEALDSGIDADITGDTSTVKQLGDALAEKAAKVILLGSLAPSANSGLVCQRGGGGRDDPGKTMTRT